MSKKQTSQKKEPPFLGQYRRCYPTVSEFYVTTDQMVFIDAEKAKRHQASIGHGEVKTY